MYWPHSQQCSLRAGGVVASSDSAVFDNAGVGVGKKAASQSDDDAGVRTPFEYDEAGVGNSAEDGGEEAASVRGMVLVWEVALLSWELSLASEVLSPPHMGAFMPLLVPLRRPKVLAMTSTADFDTTTMSPSSGGMQMDNSGDGKAMVKKDSCGDDDELLFPRSSRKSASRFSRQLMYCWFWRFWALRASMVVLLELTCASRMRMRFNAVVRGAQEKGLEEGNVWGTGGYGGGDRTAGVDLRLEVAMTPGANGRLMRVGLGKFS